MYQKVESHYIMLLTMNTTIRKIRGMFFLIFLTVSLLLIGDIFRVVRVLFFTEFSKNLKV